MYQPLKIKTATAMMALGAKLAESVRGNEIIYLCGELGAGKTTLVRGFLRALGYKGKVKSPTFTLVEEYKLADKHIYHLDLYRLIDPEELEYIGIRDYFSGEAILLIEWPERGGDRIPPADITYNIKIVEDKREVNIKK